MSSEEKQRIKRVGEVYYVEYRRWFRWKAYNKLTGGGSDCWETPIKFSTQEEANTYAVGVQQETIEVEYE